MNLFRHSPRLQRLADIVCVAGMILGLLVVCGLAFIAWLFHWQRLDNWLGRLVD